MAKPKKPDPASLLADRMLEMLELVKAKREFGGDAYPPTLRHLGELCDDAPSPDLIVKAAGKKAFTEKAVATEKVARKPSLESPVYFKGDEPPKPKSKGGTSAKPKPVGVEELARRMLAVLESQRPLGDPAYPPTLRRLAELCEVKPSNTNVPKAAEHALMGDRAVVVGKTGKKPNLDAPITLKDDIENDLSTIMPALLDFALSPLTSKSKGESIETTAFTPADLKKRFIADLQKPFEEALESGIAHRTLPRDVAWVVIKGKPLLFLLDHVRPSAPSRKTSVDTEGRLPGRIPDSILSGAARTAPTRDVVRSFLEAFDRLDRRNGSTNFVKLADLRQALSEFNHDEFDAGLRQLRIDGLLSLDSHEGLYGSLTHEEREAGVREAGSLLVYASRR